MELPKKYDPVTEEQKILAFWKEHETFAFKKDDKKKLFSIDTPPPTVSGKMHIGHSFSYSQEDFIARYKRLRGFDVFYPFGTDDNGLPTERLVEKLKNVRSTHMDRSAFRELCYKTITEIKDDFISDWIRLGISCDYKHAYSTISNECQKLSQQSFIELYKKGLVYQQEAPMSWCTTCQTAIAQAEFESKDISSAFNDIVFQSEDGKDLIISTTRPEFLPACVALFANPDDARYTHLKGKTATVPLFNFKVPILFDEVVDKEKGTGLMMVCTFGDKEDIDKWKRYNLPLRIIFTKSGLMNDLTGPYQGLKIKDARAKIIEDLKAKGILVAQKQIVHAVNVHERCGTELEFLKTRQWFIRILDQKEKLLEEVEKINWYPEYMKTRMIHWIENLNWDWCISRQRFFGIPFPVWRNKKTGDVILADIQNLPVDPIRDLPKGYKAEDVEPDTDIMDTWNTSSISPIIALTSNGLDVKQNMPMSLRPQAHDIIRTWAFYTLVRSVYERNMIPWNDILVSGFVTAANGEKMSKSKGNVVDPRSVITKYSSDILRFWAAGSKLGEDLPYKELDLMAGQKFVTKMWNSFKFLQFFFEQNPDFNPNDVTHLNLNVVDKWMLKQIDELIEKNTEDFDKYEYDKVKYRTEQFFWQVFCDNYIEIVKDRLYKPEVYGKDAQVSGLYTFYHAFKSIVIMMSPLTPFIGEGLWQYFFRNYEVSTTISTADWPKQFKPAFSEKEIIAGQLAIDISAAIRKFKSDNKKPLNSEVGLKIASDPTVKSQIELVISDIKGTIKAVTLEFVDKKDIRGDIAIGEGQQGSSEKNQKIVSGEPQSVPEKVEFFAMDVEFIESTKG